MHKQRQKGEREKNPRPEEAQRAGGTGVAISQWAKGKGDYPRAGRKRKATPCRSFQAMENSGFYSQWFSIISICPYSPHSLVAVSTILCRWYTTGPLPNLWKFWSFQCIESFNKTVISSDYMLKDHFGWCVKSRDKREDKEEAGIGCCGHLGLD